MSGTPYTLIVQNNSGTTWDMCLYQFDPSISTMDVMSLAWFAEEAANTTTLTFEWTIDYSFVWCQTGPLNPGAIFTAAQTWPADPDNIAVSNGTVAGNQIGLTYGVNGPFTFTPTPDPGAEQGSLYVVQDGTIPDNTVSVGIGMSGAGTYAVQGLPNILLDFTPTPVYWITAGTFTSGQVLNLQEITNPGPVVFPDDVYSMTATLGSNNLWTIEPTSDVNVRSKHTAAQPRDRLVGKR